MRVQSSLKREKIYKIELLVNENINLEFDKEKQNLQKKMRRKRRKTELKLALLKSDHQKIVTFQAVLIIWMKARKEEKMHNPRLKFKVKCKP